MMMCKSLYVMIQRNWLMICSKRWGKINFRDTRLTLKGTVDIIFQDNYVNAMASDALAPFIGKSSNAIVLNRYEEQVLFIHRKEFQLLGPPEKIKILCFLKIFLYNHLAFADYILNTIEFMMLAVYIYRLDLHQLLCQLCKKMWVPHDMYL